MNILYLGYWGYNEGLTQATILPHLKILAEMSSINQIMFCTIERAEEKDFDCTIPKVIHQPLYSKPSKIPLWDKIQDFIDFPNQLLQLCNQFSIDKIICRGAPAGALAYLVWKKNQISYTVESFEPHAAYMLESGVWKSFDPRYLAQRYWEKKQKQTASGLMPVSEKYKYYLVEKDGVDAHKIDTIPCCVAIDQFAFNSEARVEIRASLSIGNDTVLGIYVGKFGGIYYEGEAFEIFKKLEKKYSSFHLLILSPDPEKKIKDLAKSSNYSLDSLTIKSVTHKEVPNYLSAADIAFATIKPSEHRKYCSPIKTGEYWANGLPVVITPNVGDDSFIIETENAGLVMDYKDDIITDLSVFPERAEITKLAQKYRSFDITKNVYQKWYGKK
jgi:glycosyltransferase involved in cell wall biosynthesis